LHRVLQMFYQSAFGVSSVKSGSKCNTHNRIPSGELNPETAFVTPAKKQRAGTPVGSANSSDEGNFSRPVASVPRDGQSSTAAAPVIGAGEVMGMDQTPDQDGSGQNALEAVVTVSKLSPRSTPEPDTNGAVQGSGDGKNSSSSKLSPLNPVAGSQGSDVVGVGQAKGREPTKPKGAKSSVVVNGPKPDAQESKVKSKPKKNLSLKKRISQLMNGGDSSTSNTTAQQGGSRTGRTKR